MEDKKQNNIKSRKICALILKRPVTWATAGDWSWPKKPGNAVVIQLEIKERLWQNDGERELPLYKKNHDLTSAFNNAGLLDIYVRSANWRIYSPARI